MPLRERRFPRFLAWLLICLCFGESLLPDMVLCVEADGRVMLEPAAGGKCSDLVQGIAAGEDLGEWVSAPAYCERCLDLPLTSEASYQLPRPVQTRVPLQAVPVMIVHPLLQPLALATIRTGSFFLFLPTPSSALIALRSTLLLI